MLSKKIFSIYHINSITSIHGHNVEAFDRYLLKTLNFCNPKVRTLTRRQIDVLFVRLSGYLRASIIAYRIVISLFRVLRIWNPATH